MIHEYTNRNQITGEKASNCVELNSKVVAILPFTLSELKSIDDLYLYRGVDAIDQEQYNGLIYGEIDPVNDETNLSTAIRLANNMLNMPVGEKTIDKLFYLGTISQRGFFKCNVPLYAMNVTDYTQRGKKQNLYSDESGKIVTVKYLNLMKSDSCEALTGAALMMLVFHFSA